MKNYIVLICILLQVNVYSQDWVKNVGGDSSEVIGSVKHSVFINNSGKIISSASGASFDGTITDPVNGDLDVLVHVHDAAGNLENQRTFGGPGVDEGFVAPFGNGNYLLLGRTNSGGGDIPSSIVGDEDIWIMLLDSNLNTIWSKTYGGFGKDYPNSFWFDSVQNQLIVNFHTSSNLFLGYSNSSLQNVGIMKIDMTGQMIQCMIMDETLFGNDITSIYGLEFERNAAGIFVFGAIENTIGNWVGLISYFDNNLNLINSLIVDEIAIGYTYFDFVSADITINNPNEFYVLGERQGDNAANQFITKLIFNPNDSSLTLAPRIDLDVNIYNMWGLKSIAFNSSQKCVLYGGGYEGQGNGLALIFNENLTNIDDSIKLIGNDNVFFWDMVQYNNNLIFTGHTTSDDAIFHNLGLIDVFVAKFEINPTLGTLNKNENLSINIYPNPTLGNVYFDMIIEKLEIYNNLGLKIDEKENVSSITMSDLSPGTYTIKSFIDGKQIFITRVIKL